MAKIRKTEDSRFAFFCPGCKCAHVVNDRWSFNQDFEKPTFNPSVLVESVKLPDPIPLDEKGKYKIGTDGRIEGAMDTRCHSFVRDGKIEFLGDCTHELKGQTVDLEEF